MTGEQESRVVGGRGEGRWEEGGEGGERGGEESRGGIQNSEHFTQSTHPQSPDHSNISCPPLQCQLWNRISGETDFADKNDSSRWEEAVCVE